MRNFRDLDIWKNGVELVKDVYQLIEGFPNTEKYGLSSQISRCAVSVPSNIAEGCSRESQKDFSRFLQITLGSSYELETQLLISKELELINGS
ncbi:four helix bundle protein [Flagellimonas sp. HMM57]|uniref:four helix bundle protein n=1 Tax=unclassified Flagellimonas TaxID=2644544 RepID=UPI001F0A8378|nr:MULTISPECIES: four helix bundle protein [unclassified Flagellimonas]UII75096.1 four helix bundle protein [Flagellimonas sp. HMM57]